MGIWHQLVNKAFGLSDPPCESCDLLREQLHKCDGERVELLHRLLDKDKPNLPIEDKTEYRPITPAYTPWRVRQQMLEQEDRKRAELLRRNAQEIESLEKELEVK